MKQAVKQLVSEAIENKYEGFTAARFDAAFDIAWRSAAKMETESDLASLLSTVTSPANDVQNQVSVALLIDRFWSRTGDLARPISTIHSATYGHGRQDLRSSRSVADFDRAILTSIPELPARLDELERVSMALMSAMSNAATPVRSAFLAFVFSSIIRLHPFEDGNGRAARMFVQYALRCWKLPFLPLPKVRNDANWKQALHLAVDGEVGSLAGEFETRLRSVSDRAP